MRLGRTTCDIGCRTPVVVAPFLVTLTSLGEGVAAANATDRHKGHGPLPVSVAPLSPYVRGRPVVQLRVQTKVGAVGT